ncbi:MAG: GTPase, partial [Burkholderiales bacterium]
IVELIPERRSIVAQQVRAEFDAARGATQAMLTARRRAAVEQLHELSGLRGKNRSAIELMAARIRRERTEFEDALRQLQALRTVLKRHGERIYASVGTEALKRHVRKSREAMRASAFSTGLHDAMGMLLARAREDLQQAGREIEEVGAMMGAMYRTFSVQYGMSLGAPIAFKMKRYQSELDRVEAVFRKRFGALSMLTHEKRVLMRKFFDSVAARIRDVYVQVGRDVESWQRALMAPLEGQVREHQAQLRKRLDSVRRVFDASESLDGRIAELEEACAGVEQQLAIMNELAGRVRSAIQPAARAGAELVAA